MALQVRPTTTSFEPPRRDPQTGVELWLGRDEVDRLFTATFWNNEAIERQKEWWIGEDGDARTMLDYLQRTGSIAEFEAGVEAVRGSGKLRGRVLDAAAGSCWTSALLSRLPEIERIDAVEFSWHRIAILAERTIRVLGGDASKINRVFGSFFDIKRPPASYQIILLSAAYHHCDDLARLVSELDRCLVPGGVILLLGERPVGLGEHLRRIAATLVRQKRLVLDFRSLFPPHPEIGDHYYRRNDYRRTFADLHYATRIERVAPANWIILATKPH